MKNSEVSNEMYKQRSKNHFILMIYIIWHLNIWDLNLDLDFNY